MTGALQPILGRWRLCALLASALMLAAAHAFETFGGLAPCLLCLQQREVYWVAIAIAAAAMVVVRLPGGPRWREASCWLLALVFLAGAGIAAYHAGAEWKFWPGPTACGGASVSITAESLSDFMKGEPVKAVRCDEAAWVFAGLSMAGWNAVISLGLAALSVLAALRERKRR